MKIIALDFETGGIDPQRHGAVSLGVAVMDGDQVIDSKEWIIKPPTDKNGKIRVEYDMNAMLINGVTWKQLREGTEELQVLRELIQFAEDHDCRSAMIVSHNAVFDAAFLSQMVFRCGSWNYGKWQSFPDPLLGPWACTKRMSAKLDTPDNKLDTVCASFGLSRTGEFHGALEDAILCGKCFALLASEAVAVPA